MEVHGEHADVRGTLRGRPALGGEQHPQRGGHLRDVPQGVVVPTRLLVAPSQVDEGRDPLTHVGAGARGDQRVVEDPGQR
ncbi:hypothetical protein [Frankia sp. ArI3]|uniref:hypothetical protein n=1 Tax=Frankia sp. ArI3 TaxID=1858 RepID=UPI002103E112|nr:hypothetical protein [Frankia sp. ArI3]